MSDLIEKSLIIRKETIYDKIRKSLWLLVFKKDFQMIRKLDLLLQPNRPQLNNQKVIIPKEIGKNVKKY